MSDITTGPASGRFLLRLPPGLHSALREAARGAGLSLNDYCVRRLAAADPGPVRQGLGLAVEWAADVAGSGLVGGAAFGSWARGEEGPGSDIDLLVVVEPSFALTREAYRRWDERRLEVDGHAVEPHFVRLPAGEERMAGLWGEVAIDGIVLFERGFVLSRRLADVRRAILAGRIERRTVHGQPYWCEVA